MSVISEVLVSEVLHRLYMESLPRISKCMDQLSEAQVWWKPNPSSNSIGNLVLHLNGNVKQWIYSGLGGFPDDRRRQTEFDAGGGWNKQQLMTLLGETMDLVRPVIEQVTEDDLLTKRPVQTFEETGMSILIHVTEHFSYHTGQIAYITKMLTDHALGFYEGISLE